MEANPFGKILIFSPHPDDEVLGCGGLIAKYAKDVHVHYVTFYHPLVDEDILTKENDLLSQTYGFSKSMSAPMILQSTNKLHTLPIADIISSFEKVISDTKPDSVFVCFPSYNQDHRVVFDAVLTATRPHDRLWRVKNILVYEQPETLHTNRITNEQFRPQVFVEIDPVMKNALYGCYRSQVRDHRGPELLEAIARLRGSYISKSFAEAFECVRLHV
jgi:N-acetylglucosamine malate deacetylase 1